MHRPVSQSIDVHCEADQDMPSGVTNCFLTVHPGSSFKEYVLTALRRSTVDLEHGAYYRVTFQKIDPPK
jgi:hypothetical protein